MYAHNQRQLHFSEAEFSFFGMPLNPTNRWVQLGVAEWNSGITFVLLRIFFYREKMPCSNH